jgi:hypothetical protein
VSDGLVGRLVSLRERGGRAVLFTVVEGEGVKATGTLYTFSPLGQREALISSIRPGSGSSVSTSLPRL